MAARKSAAAEAPSKESLNELRENMINLANELIEQVRGKQVNAPEYLDKIVDIYHEVANTPID